jgi:hypothetical protein
MLEKLATHDVHDVAKLFNMANKCARTAEGHAKHSPPAPEAGKASKPNTDATTQGSGKKKKKAGGKDKPPVGAPTAAAAIAGWSWGPHGNKHPHQVSGSDNGGVWCPMHNSRRHGAEECREIKKLVKQFREQMKQ